jgi:hypothetical protein
MQKIINNIDEIVELNVGGKHFTTARSTLCRFEGSVLASMFSGRWKLPIDSKGRYFIDRNPKIFAVVLDFLREPNASIKIPEDDKERFGVDLEFYGLKHIIFAGISFGIPSNTIDTVISAHWAAYDTTQKYGLLYSLSTNFKTAKKTQHEGTITVLREDQARSGKLRYKVRVDALSAKVRIVIIGDSITSHVVLLVLIVII